MMRDDDSVDLKTITVDLPPVDIFDRLSPLEYESLFLRTKCMLVDIKHAYSNCVNQRKLHRSAVLQFALEPDQYEIINENDWLICALDERFVRLSTKDWEHHEYVEDRPTLCLLSLFVKNEPCDIAVTPDFENLYSADRIFTAQEICKTFKLSRSTFEGWQKGLTDLGMKLDCQKAENSKNMICRYGDLIPFLKYHFSSPRHQA